MDSIRCGLAPNKLGHKIFDFPNFVPFLTLLANCWKFSWGICLIDRKEAFLLQSGPKDLNLKRKAENIFFNI